jgi:hypothetical protein
MTRRLATAIIVVAVGAAWYVTLPPLPVALTLAAGTSESVRGVIHIHTRRSDGTGTVEDVARAAAQAGLKFIVLTDHGDATREPDGPTYRSGVLCIDAIEISTSGGHVVALGLGKAPYPLAGDARDVIEDIARLGGMSISAHPGSNKPELRWSDWSAPFHGLEWLNGDSEWRDESPRTLARVLLAYPGRRSSALALLLDRPDELLRRWDDLTQRRRVVAVAGSDAHARLGLRTPGEPYDRSSSLPLPGYAQVFRTFSITLPQVTLKGNPVDDAAAVVAEIRAGHVYSTVDAVATPAQLSFTANGTDSSAMPGDEIRSRGPVTVRAATNAPGSDEIRLIRNGEVMASTRGVILEQTVPPTPAVYRVEVHFPGAPGEPPVPWILSNPIYIRASGQNSVTPPRPSASRAVARYDNGPATGWRFEKSERASAALDVIGAVGGTQLLMRYALGGSVAEGPFVAFVMPAGSDLATYDRLTFAVRADHPMRLSVQLRVADGAAGERWQRSVYADATPRTVAVFFDDMTAVGTTASPRPPLDRVESVLFVVDTVNTKPGTSGQLWIDDVKYER